MRDLELERRLKPGGDGRDEGENESEGQRGRGGGKNTDPKEVSLRLSFWLIVRLSSAPPRRGV